MIILPPKCGLSSVQSLSRIQLFATPWITARQASLSINNSRSSLRLMSIGSVMPSSHLILCCPLLLLPPITPSIRVFSNEKTLRIRWPKYWSFSFSIIPSKVHPGLISFRVDWLDLLALGVELGYLFDFFLISWGKPVLLWTFPLALLLQCPIGFGLLCFHFHPFYAYFDFFFDFFYDFLVIQKRVV